MFELMCSSIFEIFFSNEIKGRSMDSIISKVNDEINKKQKILKRKLNMMKYPLILIILIGEMNSIDSIVKVKSSKQYNSKKNKVLHIFMQSNSKEDMMYRYNLTVQ